MLQISSQACAVEKEKNLLLIQTSRTGNPILRLGVKPGSAHSLPFPSPTRQHKNLNTVKPGAEKNPAPANMKWKNPLEEKFSICAKNESLLGTKTSEVSHFITFPKFKCISFLVECLRELF